MQRDVSRWEFMEGEEKGFDARQQRARDKYKIGQKGNGSAAYNPVNCEFDGSPRGQKMKEMEQLRSQRAMVRGTLIQNSSAPIFNPINGEARKDIVPNASQEYGIVGNLPGSRLNLRDSQGNSHNHPSAMSSAGRPIRSIHARILPGQFLQPNGASGVGKKVHPLQSERTINQYIPEDHA